MFGVLLAAGPHLVGDDRAVDAAVLGDRADRLLQRPGDDLGAEPLVALELLGQLLDRPGCSAAAPRRRRGRCPRPPPPGSRAGRPRRGPSSASSRPRSPPPTRMIATPPVSFASRSLNFSLSYSLSVCSICGGSGRSASGCRPSCRPPSMIVRAFLLDADRLGLAELLERDVLQLEAEVLADELPPVRTAMSPSMALRRSPKPGALTAQTLSTPRSLLTTRTASASLSTSSAMISSGLPAWATFSSSGSRSRTLVIFFS